VILTACSVQSVCLTQPGQQQYIRPGVAISFVKLYG